VNPLLPGLGLVVCIGMAARAMVLVADKGPSARVGAEVGVRAARARRRPVTSRLFELLSSRLTPRALRILGGARLSTIRQRLDAAGRPGGLSPEAYAGRKAACTVVAAVVGAWFLLRGKAAFAACVVATGFLWMDVWLAGRARRRQARIDRDLPDFLDVVAVTVGAGLGFRAAFARVAARLGGPLSEEITTALRQMELGADRRSAFEDLRRRNPSESLGRVVTALLQAEELGAPLTDALVALGGEMRRYFAQDARRRAARAAPRVSLVITMVMVPGALVLMVVGIFLGSGINLGTFTH
jgi:tight adherence protein C